MRKFLLALTALGVMAAGVWAWFTVPHLLPFTNACVAEIEGQSVSLDIEQGDNAATITALAMKRDMAARAATIAIATAIQESKLRNIDYGDRDSVGLFQQRPSQGWGSVAEIMDPIYSANAFYDELERIENYRDIEITVVAQKIQRSAFPNAYAAHEPEARAIASTLSGYSPQGFYCKVREPDTAPTTARAETARDELLDVATAEMGEVTTALDPGTRTGFEVIIPTQEGEDAETQANRRSWAVASWAVAHAWEHDVQAVTVDGYRWQRGSFGTWQSDPTSDAATNGNARVQIYMEPLPN